MRPAARRHDSVTGTDIHVVLVPAAMGAPVPTPGPHPFTGLLQDSLAADVLINGLPAATVGSGARNMPPHLPVPPAGSFQRPPSNKGTVQSGSATVLFAGRGAARQGDPVVTCNDPVDQPTSAITSGSPDVLVG